MSQNPRPLVLWPAADLSLSPLAPPPLAPSPPSTSSLPRLLVRLETMAEMKQAPDGRLFCICRDAMLPPLIPTLEFPGSELPWRQRLDAPLFPPVRRPVAETRSFLDVGLDDGARDDPAPGLARRRGDHVDEFRLIGHGSLLRNVSPRQA